MEPEDVKSSGYVVCAKCGARHSTLVKHKCVKLGKKKKADWEDHDQEKMGDGGRGGDDQQQGDDSQNGDGDDGDGQGDGDGQQGEGNQQNGEGEGEGDNSQGDGQQGEGEDGDGEGEEGQQARAPQSPEPETPPVVVVCTVLKFAALCASCAKNGCIEVNLAEDGIFVYGHNGDVTAYDTIPWGEFEQRSTLDGEFYVKEVIDQVDSQLNPADDAATLKRLIKEAKKAPKPKAESEGGKAKATGKKRKAA